MVKKLTAFRIEEQVHRELPADGRAVVEDRCEDRDGDAIVRDGEGPVEARKHDIGQGGRNAPSRPGMGGPGGCGRNTRRGPFLRDRGSPSVIGRAA